eukprot:SAG11_NODE_801_length_7112_cov_6.438329_9_plen_146_part_00
MDNANRRLASLHASLHTGNAAQAPAAAVTIDHYGKHVFKGAVAEKYLSKYGESASLLNDYSWTSTKADTVAKAVLDWAIDNGADTYCHIFQPMAASGFRHDHTAMVQLKMVEFNADGAYGTVSHSPDLCIQYSHVTMNLEKGLTC